MGKRISKNTVQIYGLPRSGTNFLEWSVLNNFKYVRYKNFYEDCTIDELRACLQIDDPSIAVKHQRPSLQYSNRVIVIHREWRNWIPDFQEWAGAASLNFTKRVYDDYLDSARLLPKKNVLMISHEWMVMNFGKAIARIEKKFDLKRKPELVQPMNILDQGGANCKQTELPYEFKEVE